MRKLFSILFSAALLLMGSAQGTWAQNVKVWDLGYYPGGSWAEPRDINNFGVVVGLGDVPPYKYTQPIAVPVFGPNAGQWFDLGTLGGENNDFLPGCRSIADTGMIVGWSPITGGASVHAFAWTQKSGMVDIGTLADVGYSGYNFSNAMGVNKAGTLIVGWSSVTFEGPDSLPVVWTSKVVWTPHGPTTTWSIQKLDTTGFEGATYWTPVFVNTSGQIVGAATNADDIDIGVLWNPLPGGKGWKVMQLPNPSDYPNAYPRAINDMGQVSGSVISLDGMTEPAALWQPVPHVEGGYKLVLLPTLSGLTLGWSEAMGINDAGDMVGYIEDTSEVIIWAVRWSTKDPNFVQLLPYPGTWSLAQGEWSVAWRVNEVGIATGEFGSEAITENVFAVKLR
jgi:probable HAF family extracellular repeat protein